MIYSVIPTQMILDQHFYSPVAPGRLVSWQGSVVEAVGDPLHPQVGRLLSTNPRRYLDPRFQPGAPLPPFPAG